MAHDDEKYFSQFTITETKKGEELYNYFVAALRGQNIEVETGKFQAMMEVKLVNDGPVTFILESGS